MKGTWKICSEGHRFYKSSDCPVCPECEKAKKPQDGFLAVLSAPARRALQRIGVQTLAQLSAYSESEILQLHGVGPSSIPRLREALQKAGLGFR